MQRESSKKQNAPSEHSIKRVLVNSVYSENTADKIWKLYNPPKLNGNKLKKQ